MTLTTIEIAPLGQANKSILWLHGLGADGNDFAPLVPNLTFSPDHQVRFIFPNAPLMPVTINSGMKMPAWYDIYGLGFNSKIDENGINRSIHNLYELIHKEEQRGIASQNIVLAGFSQGAVIALLAGLRYEKPLGGIIALSGYFPLAPATLKDASAANKMIPIFLAHGEQDPVVPFVLGEKSHLLLQEALYPVSWHTYPMPHSVCPQEIRDINQWLISLFKNKRSADGK